MGEEKEKGVLSKAIMSSLVGLFSGAILMYVSPLVNNAIKPPRPVPNFSYAVQGTQVTFNNRSTGGTTGWWEFGDNTAQEAFNPNQAEVTHKFPGPGVYPVKLSLHNFIGEEVDRIVQVKVDASTPRIDDLQLTLVSSGASADGSPTAPARFRIVAKAQDVDTAYWVIDGQPFKRVPAAQLAGGLIVEDFTFEYYGTMQIRLLGVSGKSDIEKTKEIWVGVPDESPRIMIQQAAMQPMEKSISFSVSFPATANGPVYPFEIRRTVEPGTKITKANILERPDPKLVRNPHMDIAPDGKTIVIRGELLRPANAGKNNSPSWFGKVDVTVVSTAISAEATKPVAAQLNVPGTTRVKLPTPDAAAALKWEVREGMEVVMKDSDASASQIVKLKNQMFRVTVTRVGNDIQIDATDPSRPVPFQPTSNPR